MSHHLCAGGFTQMHIKGINAFSCWFLWCTYCRQKGRGAAFSWEDVLCLTSWEGRLWIQRWKTKTARRRDTVAKNKTAQTDCELCVCYVQLCFETCKDLHTCMQVSSTSTRCMIYMLFLLCWILERTLYGLALIPWCLTVTITITDTYLSIILTRNLSSAKRWVSIHMEAQYSC